MKIYDEYLQALAQDEEDAIREYQWKKNAELSLERTENIKKMITILTKLGLSTNEIMQNIKSEFDISDKELKSMMLA